MVRFPKFRRGEEILDYTDRGKNIPKINSDYGITKEGFIVVKEKNEVVENKFDNIPNINNSPSQLGFFDLPINANQDSNQSNSSGFDFLDSNFGGNIGGVSSSNNSTNTFNNSESEEIKKMVSRISNQANENSNELYKLLVRIEELERKISFLEGK